MSQEEEAWKDFFDKFDMDNVKFIQQHYCYLETTLNYPRSSRWNRLCYKSKVQLYHLLISYLKLHLPFIKYVDATIENCKNGEPHMHAQICCVLTNNYSPEGLVMDVVGHYIDQLPKRSQTTLHKYEYNHFLQRFKCPSICINYKQYNADTWQDYINKFSQV